MKNGIKPIKRDPRDYSFHKTFGSVSVVQLPEEFSVDKGLGFPDQNADGFPYGCTSYSQNNLCSNQDGVLYDDYEFTYKKTLEKEGIYTLNQGCDIRDSLKTVIAFGPRKKGEGDTYAHERGAYYAIEKNGDWFDSIRSTIFTNKLVNKIDCTVSTATQWFPTFEQVNSAGVISNVLTGSPSWHNYEISGWRMIDGEMYLEAKSWQGKNYGKGGWCYFSRSVINRLLDVEGSGVFTVAPKTSDVGTIKKTLGEFILTFIANVAKLFQKQATTTVPVVPAVEPVKTDYQQVKEAITMKLDDFCNALRDYEGKPGELNYRNNNPGNCRCSSKGYAKMYGVVKCVNNFAVFPTYELGFLYLKNLIKSRIKANPNIDIYGYINIHAPSGDNNNPKVYAEWVAKRLGVPPTTLMNTFL